MSICRKRSTIYGSPPWNTGAALRFLSLRRDFLHDCWRSKAAPKLTSSTKRCCWDAGAGLAISKRLLTGLRLMLLFLDFPEETRKLLGPGTLAEGAFTGTYSTRPSSITFEILTPDRDVESSDDGLIPPTAYHCSCESFNILRRSRTSPIQPQMSATTWGQELVSTWFHGSKTVLCVIFSERAADSVNMEIPESEKKLRWVKCRLLTKSCTQRIALRTSSLSIITPSKLMMNRSPQVTGPRTIRSVNWKTWKRRIDAFQKWHYNIIALVAIHTLNRCCRARKPACEQQNDRTSPISGRLLVEDRSRCRCSWTKDWYSDRQPSISLPFTHPRSNRPSSRRPNKRSGAWLSPPMMIAGQKQLKPCPIFERAATTESTEVVNCSKKLRASRWNSRLKHELPILLRAANTRVLARNSPSWIGGNLEWLGNTYSSIAPQAAKRIPVRSSAADSRWTEPVRQTCGTRSHLLFDDGWNYSQLKQKYVS